MWEAIKDILISSNATPILLFFAIIILISFFCIKNNYLIINTSSVKIGADEKERSILRQQSEWVSTYIHGLVLVIQTKFKGMDETKTRLILEYVYDEIVTWIMFNHITKSEMYLMVKQERIRGIVFTYATSSIVKEEKFCIAMNQWVKEVINRLVDIREYYSK